MKTFLLVLATALTTTSAAPAQVSSDTTMPMATKGASAPATAPAMTDGVVHSIDAKKGVVTLKHGEIVNMKMPAMTMAFGVADKKMLDRVKVGDKVKFQLEMVKNTPTVTRLEPAR